MHVDLQLKLEQKPSKLATDGIVDNIAAKKLKKSNTNTRYDIHIGIGKIRALSLHPRYYPWILTADMRDCIDCGSIMHTVRTGWLYTRIDIGFLTEFLDTICTVECSASVEEYRQNVAGACANERKIFGPPIAVADFYFLEYKLRCLKDGYVTVSCENLR